MTMCKSKTKLFVLDRTLTTKAHPSYTQWFLKLEVLLVFFGSLFTVEIDVKDDFLLKNEVLPSKNVIFVYKGRYPKIQRNFS